MKIEKHVCCTYTHTPYAHNSHRPQTHNHTPHPLHNTQTTYTHTHISTSHTYTTHLDITTLHPPHLPHTYRIHTPHTYRIAQSLNRVQWKGRNVCGRGGVGGTMRSARS